MKKATDARLDPAPAPVVRGVLPPEDEDDDLLPEYDFRGGQRSKYAGQFYEGAEVFINDVRHVVRGKAIVPEPLPPEAVKQTPRKQTG